MTEQHQQKPLNHGGRLFAWVALISIFGLFFIYLTMPDVGSGPVSRRSMCRFNLKEIGLALHNYHDDHGCFPPAYIADENGRPMHSWRVLLLPYLDQIALYKQYSFDEPWNGPNNSRFLDLELPIFRCLAEEHDDKTITSYVAVVGPNTVFPETESVRIGDIKDGSSNTLMIVEVENSGIHWMDPRDLHVYQMARTINPKAGQGISGPHEGGAYALLADGSVRFLWKEMSPETLRRLLEINDGEEVGEF